jgi:hypothetical protein
MAWFKISYEAGILICVFAILVGSQIFAIHVEHCLVRSKRRRARDKAAARHGQAPKPAVTCRRTSSRLGSLDG